jgi:hypothetical protein
MSIDYNAPTGQVRLLLSDIDPSNQVFTDDEIGAFLAIENGSVKRAAAQAIDTQATNEALAAKVFKDHQLETDGAKLADAMRKHAAALRDQAKFDEENSDDGFFFDVVDVVGCENPTPPELTGWPYGGL